ncbi:alpha/beta fold hydrolase [Flavitalea flava]
MDKLISKDGTHIAYDKTGNGPALILTDGAFCSRKFGPMVKLAPLLVENFTVYTYDRRGRGDSGDTMPYAIQREMEDLEVLAGIARDAKEVLYLFGISSGAALAVRAVAAGLPVTRLALFEPPYIVGADSTNGKPKHQPPADAEEQLKRMIAGQEKGNAVRFFLRKVMGIPAIVPFIMQFLPVWSKMKANANALPYEAAIMGDFRMPKKIVASLRIPTLVLASDKSPEILREPALLVAETIPNGQGKIVKGQIHDVPAKVLAPVLRDFFITP